MAIVAAPLARGYVRHAPWTLGKTPLSRRLLEPVLRAAPRDFSARTVDGLRINGTTRDMIQRYLYMFGVWEPNLTAWLRSRPLEGRTLVDVGANIGYFSLLASRLVGPTGHVVAIEALPDTFAQLVSNIERNAATNIRALNLAAAAHRGEVDLFGGEPHNSGTTSTVPSPGLVALGTVETAPLAELLTDLELRSVRVVKVDVEGGEPDVIEGLLGALGKMPDDVELVVEITPPAAPRVHGMLEDLGFHAYRLENTYALAAYAERRPPELPRRLSGPIHDRTDVIFSRVDAEVLP